ncbi:MAG TPA: glycosyltransferase [Acidimicrobiales bacterium]|nr:glycosyltransferase [Acidimicrobiales bacterium]
MRRLAVLSMHTSPLAQPGTGDGGGMNVYVRELSTALARAGVQCDVYTRAWSADLPATVTVEPGLRLHHVPAGELAPMPKERLGEVVEEFTDNVLSLMTSPVASDTGSGAGGHVTIGGGDRRFDAVHANYWLSGLAGHRVKHELDLPLVSTFHTLARVKAELSAEEMRFDEPHRRAEAEATVMACSEIVLASCTVEAEQLAELYEVDPARLRVVPPGVDHAFFGPGDRSQARRALGLPRNVPVLLFVGRIQPLKGADVAVHALAGMEEHPEARLVIVGGPSGPHGEEHMAFIGELAGKLGVSERVSFVDPQPHELLSTHYRAADVCIVPSRSESFGLVALEAAACGTPVVASAVGGLSTLVEHGRTGLLVEDPAPAQFAKAVSAVLADRRLAERLSQAAAARAQRYTWASAASLLRATYEELAAERLVACR